LAAGSLPKPLGIVSGGTQPQNALLGDASRDKNADFVVEQRIVNDAFEQIPSSDD